MKSLMLALAWVAAAYLALVAWLAWRQDKLLYLPTRVSAAQLPTKVLRAWPDEQELRGLVAGPAHAQGTAIVFHGNAGHAADRLFYAAGLVPLGWRVVLAEYPGYGARPGPHGEAGFVSDALLTVARARQMYGGPLILIGESLGAGVATAVAAQRPADVAGLLLITPWDRLVSVARHHYPWLPVGWLLRDRYDSAAHLATAAMPVLIVVAEDDRIVPPRFGAALHAAAAGPKRLVVIADAGHNDWPGRVDERWWREALAFLRSTAP